MKKTIDAIHSFGKKISAGKGMKSSIKTTTTKDKSQEPKTIKKTNVSKNNANPVNSK